ncbi:MAG: YbhB/YbcL family Raf kinase inhibitor-like protein, partial [Nitrososphaerales archaeon]
EAQFIPVKYTCQGQDVSPPLEWQGVLEGTKEFAIECFDPDAPGGGFVHWVLYNIPGNISAIEEGKIPKGSREGMNDFGRNNYGGPCPPRGRPHRYVFTIYALDKALGEIYTLDDLKRELKGHVLAEARLTGLYQRK